MGYAAVKTLIPLDRLAYHLQIDPYHFNQIYTDSRAVHTACDDMWFQHDWQAAGRISRESLALALKQAEDVVSTYLQWTPLPVWFNETHRFPAHYRTELYSYYNSNSQPKSVTTNWGFVMDTGARGATLLGSPATVFSDPDGDGHNELVTVAVATTVTDEEELRVYYPGKGGRDEWEIRPLTSITIAAGVATITFPKYLIALETLLEMPPTPDEPHIGIDGDDDSNFLRTVDVYRIYNDVTNQATFYYPNTGCTNPPCDDTTNTGCLSIRDGRLGILAYDRADWDDTDEEYDRQYFTQVPERIGINYRAGRQDTSRRWPTREMDITLERMICFYALSLVDTEICGCSNTRNIWEYQTRDLGAERPESTRYTVPWSQLGNPLGTAFSAIRLWLYIQPMRLAKSPHPR